MKSLFLSLIALAPALLGQDAADVTFTPSITGIITGRTLEGKAVEILSVNDFGADPMGGADSLPAFVACYAQSDFCLVPDGHYVFASGGLVIDRSNSGFICKSAASVISYTGSANIDSVVTVGSALGPYRQRFDRCSVNGNAHVKYGVHVFQSNHSNFLDLRIKNAAIPMFIDRAVSVGVDYLEVSNASGASTTEPTTGVLVFSSNTITIRVPTIEYIASSERARGYRNDLSSTVNIGSDGISVTRMTGPDFSGFSVGDPIYLHESNRRFIAAIRDSAHLTLDSTISGSPYTGWTLAHPGHGIGIDVRASVAVTVDGGTSESNKIGSFFDVNSASGERIHADDEDNLLADVRIAGIANRASGYFAGSCSSNCAAATNVSVELTPTARQNVVSGILGSIVQVDSGATDNTVELANLGNSACCLTDNGTRTTKRLNNNCCGAAGGPLPDSNPATTTFQGAVGISGPITARGCVNCFREVSAATVTAASWSAGLITFTTTEHFLFTGDAVTITGASPSKYNVTGMATVANGNVFSVVAADPGAWIGGGTAVGPGGVSANNAIVAVLSDELGGKVPITPGLRVLGRLTHSLKAGANTLNLNGSGANKIIKTTDGENLSYPYQGSGDYIDLVNGGSAWMVMSDTSPSGGGGGVSSLAGSGATGAVTVTNIAGPYIASETAGSANNAIIATAVNQLGAAVTVAAGLRITLTLTHSLQAGPNTLNLNGSGAMTIIKPTDGGNLTVPYLGGGLAIDLMNYGGTNWMAMAAQ